MSIQEKIRYGAVELKSIYTRNLGMALGVSVLAHLALIGLYVFSTNAGGAAEIGAGATGPVKMTKLPPPPPPPAEEFTPPPPPPPMVPPEMQSSSGGTGGVLSVAGNPVPTPDIELAPDAPSFASESEISMATSTAGDGTGFGGVDGGSGFGNAPTIPQGNLNIDEKEAEKEYDIFDFTEAESPKWDEAELARNIKYPAMAKNNNLEGRVVLSFVVVPDPGGTGAHAEKIEVLQSDQAVFERAAIDALSKLRFTPAYQQGKAVRVKMTIPVVFQLAGE